jgi:HK97 family phage major capsid protein
MDQKMIDLIANTLKEILPNAIEAHLDAKTAEKFTAIEAQLAEVNKSIKLGLATDTKEIDNKSKKDVASFFKAYAKGKTAFEAEMKTADYMNETTDAEGAYLVPIEFAKEVFRVAGTYGLARKYARIIPMSTDTKNISSLVNDVVCYWTDE